MIVESVCLGCNLFSLKSVASLLLADHIGDVFSKELKDLIGLFKADLTN